MTFTLPPRAELQSLGRDMGMNIGDTEADEILNVLGGIVPGFRTLERLPDELPPVRYPRSPGFRPEPADNPFNAWYVKTSIKGAPGGKLKGRKIGIKDNVAVAGVPMMCGASLLEGYTPDTDATIVTRILDAGGEIAGKVVCEYFCFAGNSATSEPAPVLNPRNPGHTPGGSSTGSAAVIVAGDVDMTIGCDQAGSIRIPSSFSGIVGLKPTHGLVPYTGIMGLETTIDHAGPMARNAADCALLLEAIAGDDGIDGRQREHQAQAYTQAIGKSVRGLKIAVVREGFGRPESEKGVDGRVREAARKLGSLGAEVEEVSIPWHNHGAALWMAICNEGVYLNLVHSHGATNNGQGYYSSSLLSVLGGWQGRAAELPATVTVGLLLGAHANRNYRLHYYAKAQNLRRRLRAEYDRVLARADLLLMPTTAMTTLPIPPESASLTEVLDASWCMLNNTCPFDVTGHPAISVPCGDSDGKPVGLMLVGKHFDEMTIFRAASAYLGEG